MCWVSGIVTHLSIIYTRTTASTTSGIDEICQSAWERISRSDACLSAVLVTTLSRFIHNAARLVMKVRKFGFFFILICRGGAKEKFERKSCDETTFEIPFSFSTSTVFLSFAPLWHQLFLPLSRLEVFFLLLCLFLTSSKKTTEHFVNFVEMRGQKGTDRENDFFNFICLNIFRFCSCSLSRICMSRLVDRKWYNIYHRSSRWNQAWRLH